ncbi:MAG: S9 family peptidase [Caldilineaceae bacterium]|nr:S9 family peptidase [Caldilineaceae bacterium]
MSSSNSKRLLTAQDLFRFIMADDPQISPDGTQVAWVRTWTDAESNSYRAQICITTIADGATRRLTNGPGQDIYPRWSPDGAMIAYLASPEPDATPSSTGPKSSVSVIEGGAQLMLVSAGGGKPQRLTNLLGGVRAPAWSPDGTRIAFLTYVDPAVGLEFRNSKREANEDDLYDKFNRDVLVTTRLRWKWDTIGYLGDYRSHIALVSVGEPDAVPVLLTQGAFDLSAPAWSPDGHMLATTGNLAPDGEAVRNSYIYLLDISGSAPYKLRQLFGLEEMRSNDLAWSPDGTTLAVGGHNDPVIGHYGNQMLWLVNVADGTADCTTRNFDRALGDYSRNYDLRRYGGNDGPRWRQNGEELYVLINEGGSVDLGIVERRSGAVRQLTQGNHSVFAFTMDHSQERIVLLIGDDMNPGDLFVLEPNDEGFAGLRRLTDVNQELLDELEMTEPIRFSAPSGDVVIDSWLIPPVNQAPGERYPVILYTGGGPGGMRASVFCHEFHLYAAHGYAVLHCNTRGNHGYGEAFSVATRGKWGDLDYEDNLASLHTALERFDFLDPARLAVAGGSYGGYSALWIASRHPEFNAAVVDRCMFNRYSFNGTSDMGFLLDQIEFDKQPPWENITPYLERSPMKYVEGIRTPTLVIHSGLDHRCPVEQGEQLFMALKRLDVPTELVRFPNESHELSRSGRPWHRVFRLERYLDWFARWL